MKAKLIIKGVLLFVTALVISLWLCGIESIMDKGYFIPWTLTMVILIYLCRKYVLTNKWLNKIKE